MSDTIQEIGGGIYRIGYFDREAGFSNNTYVIRDEGSTVLIDPGSNHPLFRDIILLTLQQLCTPESIRYVVISQPRPDICGILLYIEQYLHPQMVIFCHPTAAVYMPYFGIRSPVFPVGSGDRFQLPSGRMIRFLHFPYMQASYTFASYDCAAHALFSGTLFSTLHTGTAVFAESAHLPQAARYLSEYCGSQAALDYAADCLAELPISHILPQHGVMIAQPLVPSFLQLLRSTEPASLLRGARRPMDTAYTQQFIADMRAMLGDKAASYQDTNDIQLFAMQVSQKDPHMLRRIVPYINEQAKRLNIPNPLAVNRIYTQQSLSQVQQNHLLSAVQKQLVQADYTIGDNAQLQTGNTKLASTQERFIILFADIRGFTQWCETRSPQQIVSHLNKEYEELSRITGIYGGRVNKIMGDGLLAYFPETAVAKSITAAAAMQRAIAADSSLLPIGIGLDIGTVILGDLGEYSRLDYTLIGAPVNHASRMCSLADAGQITMSSAFFALLPEHLSASLPQLPSFCTRRTRIKPSDPELASITVQSEQLFSLLSPQEA
ncbi:MAG TPA: hypothetical protein IAA30_04670 [Candidatus Treponema faecavium]|nr:hypothetical protein [Candidatus Treponema faecavium]